jgi:hypothetical protein
MEVLTERNISMYVCMYVCTCVSSLVTRLCELSPFGGFFNVGQLVLNCGLFVHNNCRVLNTTKDVLGHTLGFLEAIGLFCHKTSAQRGYDRRDEDVSFEQFTYIAGFVPSLQKFVAVSRYVRMNV